MYKYEMDPSRTVGTTEQTRDVGRTDGQTDGRSETNNSPQQLRCAGGIITTAIIMICDSQHAFMLHFVTPLRQMKKSMTCFLCANGRDIWHL